MVTLAEIESVAAGLPPAEKQELMLFLASRLRAEGALLPEPGTFTPDEMAGWIAEDEGGHPPAARVEEVGHRGFLGSAYSTKKEPSMTHQEECPAIGDVAARTRAA